jgi:DNA polymerase-3 subunit epsilon/CBS domain-containing protein
MVTPRNLLRERATQAIVLGDEIEAAVDGATLAAARAKLVPLATGLIDDDMEARGICAVISAELCALTQRAAELAEERMAAEGKGSPPVPYAVLVLGSGGRGESLLAPDQDNAIVYERGEAGGPEDKWFAELGAHIADTLDLAGIPYCKGGVMARNADWRRSVADWRATVDGWIRRSRPEDLLQVDIFFDAVAVHGDASLGEEVWKHAYAAAGSSAIFQKLLTELARDWRSPLGLFGGFRADKGDRTDLKLGGLMPIFTGARVLSIRHGVLARSTPQRLRGAAEAGALRPADADTVLVAHETIVGAILRQQLADASAGVPPSNLVDTARLAAGAKARLRQAVKDISLLIDAISEARL